MDKNIACQPNEIVVKFFKAISAREWKIAFQYCQKSWASTHSIDQLKDLLSDTKFRYLSTVNEKIENDYIIDIEVLCNTKFGRRIHTARLVCESEPYRPDVNGEWGVNPNSILRWRSANQ